MDPCPLGKSALKSYLPSRNIYYVVQDYQLGLFSSSGIN